MNRRLFLPVAAAFLLSASTMSAYAEDGTIYNGGFENGASGWWGPGVVKGCVQDGAGVDAGRALVLRSGWACQDKRPARGGSAIRVSADIKCDGTEPDSVYVQISFRGGNLGPKWYGPASVTVYGNDEPAVFKTGGSHGWRRFSAVLKIPEGADQTLIYLRHGGKSGTAFFDNVQIVETSEAPTAPALPDEIVKNGGFENGASGWWGPGVVKDCVQDGAGVDAGRALVLRSGWACQDKMRISGGLNYRISAKIRAKDAGDNTIFVQLSFRGENVDGSWRGAQILPGLNERVLFYTGGSHEWKEFSAVVKAPEKADQILIYLRKKGDSGTAVFDSVSIAATEEPCDTAASIKLEETAAMYLAPEAAHYVPGTLKPEKPDARNIKITTNGNTAYRIFAADTKNIVSLSAAVTLAEYLGKITGADFFPIEHAESFSGAPMIIVGMDGPVIDDLYPGRIRGKLGRDGFEIRPSGRNVIITADTPRGVMYGVNWFLDRYAGVKWFSPDYTHVPSAPDLTVYVPGEKQKPRFEYREVFSSEAHNDEYAAHNLLNGRSHGRSYTPSAPEIDDWESWWAAKGGDANFWTLLGEKGKKIPGWNAGGQTLMMNPEIRRIMANSIVERLRKLEDYRSVVFNVHDMDWGWDMDPESRKFAEKHGSAPSAPRLDMMLDISARVRKVFPDAVFSFNPYHWSFSPPEGMSVPEYIIPFPMTIHVDYAYPLFAGPNKKLGEDIEGWCEISKRLLIWDHTVNFFGFLQPTPNIFPICESIKWLSRKKQVMGYFAEDSWMTPGAENAAMRTWIIARMLWDPSLDPEKLVREFAEGCYGPAVEQIIAYIKLSHENILKCGGGLREKTSVMSPYINFDFLYTADKLMEQAADSVKNMPVFLKHVENLRMAVDCPLLLRRAEFDREAAKRGLSWRAGTEARHERFFRNWDAAKVRCYIQGGSRKELEEILEIERKKPEKPDFVADISPEDWVEFQDMSIIRYGSKIVADKAASDGAAVRLSGNNTVWAAQFFIYNLPPQDEWDVFLSVRIDRGVNSKDEASAVNIGVSPPMNNFITLKTKDLSETEYKWVKAPGGPITHTKEHSHTVYVQPCKDAVKNIYVDRIIAVRKPK